MTFIKSFKRVTKKIAPSAKGQVSLEYFILFLIVALGIVASNFLWFTWTGAQSNATGESRDILEEYFDNVTQRILD